MTLVSCNAPDFVAPAVKSNGEIESQFCFSKATQGKYTLLFFYPLNFTFVCPSELLALHNRMAEFQQRGVEVIVVSIDSQFSHLAWRNTPINQGGIGPVAYTMVSDASHNICKTYGVQHPHASVAFRAAFIIDKQGIVQSEIVNNLPLGRDMDELLRLIDAVQHHETHGEVCPAGWRKGKKGMQATAQGVAEFLDEHHSVL